MTTLESCPVVLPLLNKTSRTRGRQLLWLLCGRKKSRVEGTRRPLIATRESAAPGRMELVATAAAVSLAIAPPAWAQNVEVEPWVTARVTASDNAGLGFATAGRDLITDVTAGLRVRLEGARTSLSAAPHCSRSSTRSTRRATTSSRLSTSRAAGPPSSVFSSSKAGARTTQTHIDPFAPGLSETSTDNNATVTQYRLSPYIESQPAPNLHFRARSDNTKTKDYGHESADFSAIDSSYFGFHTISLERDPLPLGWRVEAERSKTQYQGEFVPLITDIARALVNVTVVDTLRSGPASRRRRGQLPDGYGVAIHLRRPAELASQ